VNPAGRDGLFAGGGYALLGAQAIALVVAVGYAFALTYLIAGLLDRVVGLRVPARAERLGLDLALHGESAYAGDAPVPGVPGPRPPGASPAVRTRPSPPGEPPEPSAVAAARQDVQVVDAVPGTGGTDA
jgi:Amt family ammonium transporter